MSKLSPDQPAVILCEAYDSLREGRELVLCGRYLESVCRVAELANALERVTPSLLIVDVDHQTAPYEVLTRIRAAYADLPVFLLAREFSLEQQTEAVRLLTNVSFMTKPFSTERLLEKAQTLIQGYASSPPQRHILRIAK